MEVGHEQSHSNSHGWVETSDHAQKGGGRRRAVALVSTRLDGDKRLDSKGPGGSGREALGSETSGRARKDLVESGALELAQLGGDKRLRSKGPRRQECARMDMVGSETSNRARKDLVEVT